MSRILTAAAVMLFILLVLVVALALRAGHRPACIDRRPTRSFRLRAAEASRLQSATDAVDSATTAARAALASLPGFPTTANVSGVINPYINSLQLYDNFPLRYDGAGSHPVDGSSRPRQRCNRTSRFLESIDGLPASRLGAFLQQFETNAAQLQSTLSTLEQWTALHRAG